jgi:hypothetical protein
VNTTRIDFIHRLRCEGKLTAEEAEGLRQEGYPRCGYCNTNRTPGYDRDGMPVCPPCEAEHQGRPLPSGESTRRRGI